MTASGAAVCWGDNVQGDLGNGAYNTPSASPVQVTGLAERRDRRVRRNLRRLRSPERRAWCWGYNNLGQLGNGFQRERTSRPLCR